MTPSPGSPVLLPRPARTELEPGDRLRPKRRSPERRPVLDDVAPARPAKRATPRAGVTSLFYAAEAGKFVPHRIPSVENLARLESVFSNYFIEARILGMGSYATVYDAKYRLDEKRYAVKIFSRKASEAETENEVRQVSFLQERPHANCLSYYFAWSDKKFDEYGIVTEMCELGTLKAILASSALMEGQIWDYFLDLLHGLAHIHSNGLRHLDISPQNLFVAQRRVLKIGDFGVASPVGCAYECGRGSVPYSAPELLEAAEGSSGEAGTAADMYSAGVILYEMVSDFDVVLNAKHWQTPPPHRQFAVLTGVCGELMQREAALRPTAAQLLARPEIATRSRERAALVAASAVAQGTFPLPEEMSGVKYNPLAKNGPGKRVVRSLF